MNKKHIGCVNCFMVKKSELLVDRMPVQEICLPLYDFFTLKQDATRQFHIYFR